MKINELIQRLVEWERELGDVEVDVIVEPILDFEVKKGDQYQYEEGIKSLLSDGTRVIIAGKSWR